MNEQSFVDERYYGEIESYPIMNVIKWCYILPSLVVSNGCSISRCFGREVLFLIKREILPKKYLREQKVSRFAEKSTKFKKLPTASEARGCGTPHTPLATPLLLTQEPVRSFRTEQSLNLIRIFTEVIKKRLFFLVWYLHAQSPLILR